MLDTYLYYDYYDDVHYELRRSKNQKSKNDRSLYLDSYRTDKAKAKNEEEEEESD